MPETGPGQLDEITEGVRALVPLLAAMDLRVVEAGPGRAAAEIPAGPNSNHFGALYAGSLFSVAEMLGGVLATHTFDLPGFVPLVRSVEIEFLRPATTGVRARTSLAPEEVARVQGQALERGKADFALETEVVDDGGVVVARSRGAYQVRRMG